MNSDEYRAYLRTEEWRERRAACLKEAEYRCYVCGGTKKLQAHHLTYGWVGQERPEDLVCLCDGCHGECHVAFGGDVGTMLKFKERKELVRGMHQPGAELVEIGGKRERVGGFWGEKVLFWLGAAVAVAVVIWLAGR